MCDERKSIDVARTVANYAIVLMHAWAAEQYVTAGTWEYRTWDFICNAVTAMVLPALFFLSGYLMMRNFRPASYGTKLGRRVKRLLIPYVAWNATFVAFYLCVSRFVPRMRERVESFGLSSWQGAFEKVFSFTMNPIDIPTWFMRTLMVYALLSLPLWFFLRRWKGALAYGILAIWFALTLQLGWANHLNFSYPFYSILSFTLGAHLSLLDRSPFDLFKSRKWLLLAVIGMAGLAWYRIQWHWAYSPVRDVSFMLMLPGLFAAAPFLCRLADRVPNWDFFRRSSFFLYTGHFLFCSCVLHTLAPRFTGWQGCGKLTFLIAVFCTLGVAVNLGTYWLGRKLLGKWFGIWDGTL